MVLNPNSDRNEVDNYINKNDVEKQAAYQQFFNGVDFIAFRHINNLSLKFIHPISVISGSNKSGKTSALMAIACSHYNFDRQNVANGIWGRSTWSDLVRFTIHDVQSKDWIYKVYYREGSNNRSQKGYRKSVTKKWGGAGKKESQIGKPTPGHTNGGRHVCLIDLNRINPGRHLTTSTYNKARKAAETSINNEIEINDYLSYILEVPYSVSKLAETADNNVYKFSIGSGNNEYTTFNTASGEDVLINLLNQILHMQNYSLILIDELEIGLHPKIQRRLMDVIYMISRSQHKQFIITSHSYAIIDSVPKESRLFIDNDNGTFSCKDGLTTYETLTRMDSQAFPVAIVYVEDDISKNIIREAISDLNTIRHGFSRLVKCVVVGAADRTYNYFKTRKTLSTEESLFAKAACVLDGDMRSRYTPEESLFFHFSEKSPEVMLANCYLDNNPNENLKYHVENSNPHCILSKMVDLGLASDTNDAFSICFRSYKTSVDGSIHYNELKNFLLSLIV